MSTGTFLLGLVFDSFRNESLYVFTSSSFLTEGPLLYKKYDNMNTMVYKKYTIKLVHQVKMMR